MSGKIKHILSVLFIASLILSVSPVSSARPAVVLAFDDGWTSQYYKAFPIMQANNQKGTDFIITGEVAGATGQEGIEYMNLSQLTKLYAAGWDLSSHTVTHPFLTQLSTTAMNTELSASKTWLNNAKFTRGSMFLAYPYGDYNINVITALKNNGYLAARTVCGSDPSNWCYADLTAYPRYNVTSPDRYEMITLLADGYASKTDSWITTPAYIKNEINNTISSNGFLIITFHEIVDTVPGYNEEYTTSDFKIVSDYLKSRSADIDVVTLSKLFNQSAPVPTITYMPPKPTISATIGSNYVLTTWVDGIGNKTDKFNVLFNGVWNNGTTNHSANQTGMTPGQSSNVSVYAINGTTMNPTPATLVSTILTTPIQPPTSGSVKITADKDTWVAQASPTTNYGSDIELVINHGTNAEEAALIHYNLALIPAGVTITGATQYMYLEYTSANTLKANRLTSDFVEGTVNWNTKPTVNELVTSYLINPSSVGWKPINITTAVKNWYTGTWYNNGLYINSTIDDEAAFTSINGTNKPYIIVNYTADLPTLTPTPTSTPTAVPDIIPPVITITAPAATNYTEGSTVLANFTCNDETALASCTGTVTKGSSINTTGTGSKIFAVNATDVAGNSNSKTVQYTVIAVPSTPTPTPTPAPTLTPTPTPTGNPVTVKLTVTEDTYTSSSSPTKNYGTALALLGQSGNKIYLKVNTSGIPQTAIILNTSLTTSISYSAGAGILNIYRVTSAWAEKTMTGATVVTTGSSFATIAYQKCSNDCWRTDAGFTGTVQGWVNRSIVNNGILAYASTGNYVEINSHETDFKPYMTITYI